MDNNYPKLDNILYNSPPEVVRIINSRLASAVAALNSFFSELASDSNYPPAEGPATFSSFLYEPSRLVEQHGTDAGSQEQELPLKNKITILNRILNTLLDDNIFGATKQPNGDYSCHYCSKSMKNKGNMRQHIRTHRTEKLPNDDSFAATKQPNGGYSCKYCSKFVKQRNDMRKHIRTHTGEKLFQCSICGKRCNRKGNLKSHMLRHMIPYAKYAQKSNLN